MRGNLLERSRGFDIPGSIPACAGKPLTGGKVDLLMKVYPRVCGETVIDPTAIRYRMGLSPRVRGNPLMTMIARRLCGSIPACAGKPKEQRYDV